MGRGTLGVIRDGSLDSRIFPGHVGGPPRRFGTGRVSHWEVRDESGYPWRGPRQVERHSGRSGVGRGTLKAVRDGSLDPRRGLGRVVRP